MLTKRLKRSNRFLGRKKSLRPQWEKEMPKVNADRNQEWLEFEISLGEEIAQLLAIEDSKEMGLRIGEVIEERRGEIHRHLTERIDQALSEEVERLVEGHSEGRTKRDVNRLDERYFRLRLQLDAILTTAGVDGRPMRRTESIEELFDRGQTRARTSTGTSAGGGGASVKGNTSSDQRSNTLNPNNPASSAAASNRSNQMNPNNSSYRSSRGGNR